MEPVFRIEREKQDFIFYKEYVNDKSILGFHSNLELYFIDDGEMDISINKYNRILKKGEMCVVSSYDSHCYSTPEYSKSSVLIIPSYLCQMFIDTIGHKHITSPFILDKKIVKEIKSYIRLLNNCSNNEIKKQGYIYIILGIVLDNIFLELTDDVMDIKLSSKLLTYINDNFKEDISLESIAHTFGYNKSYISRYFKSCFNIGFNRYLCSVRLNHTISLMRKKENSLIYCAMESGFNSMRTFYRAFYNEFKCTPKEYLERI
jgi:AraC-like DNA-binding protein